MHCWLSTKVLPCQVLAESFTLLNYLILSSLEQVQGGCLHLAGEEIGAFRVYITPPVNYAAHQGVEHG